MKRFGGYGSLTTWTLAALAAGFLLGALGNAQDSPATAALAEVVRPAGALWVAALQMTVLPLVVAQLFAAIVGTRGTAAVGGLAARAVLLFLAMLGIAAALTLALAPLLVAIYPVDPATVRSLRAAAPTITAPQPAASAEGASFADWLAGLLPDNLFAAALNGELLPLLLFTILLALAITRLPDAQREPLALAIQGLATAMLTVVRWVLWFAPIGVFALVFILARYTGGTAVGFISAFILITSILLVVITLLLYPASAVFGRMSLRAFAQGVAPAQLVAASTRSSIASLPALVQGGREHMKLPASATGFVLPLSVSIFKINRMVSAPTKLFFIAHVYGIPLSAGTIATFMVVVVILSFSTSGTPSAGPMRTLPAYLAAGMPIEALVILEAVDVIPDIFKTVLNVTGDMSAATILSRSSRATEGAVPAPEPALDAA